MKLSIIVPVYNSEAYLDRCVHSLINQSYKDKEIILVDDESPDNCPSICDNYAKNYDFIKVIHKKNGGLSSARNAGLDIANGDYIGFIDSDDFIHKDFYKILIEECERNNCEISMAHFLKFNSDNVPNDIDIKDYEIKVYDTNKIIVSDYVKMKHIFETSVCLKVYKRKIFHDIRFNENIPYLEDVYIKPETMLKSNNFAVVNLPIYYYFCDNSQSLVSNRKYKKHSNITVDIYINKVLFENKIDNIEIITQNKLFSILYTFSKMASYYDMVLLEKSYNEIIDFYEDKISIIRNPFVKYLYILFKNKKYNLLKILCVLTFDLYKI